MLWPIKLLWSKLAVQACMMNEWLREPVPSPLFSFPPSLPPSFPQLQKESMNSSIQAENGERLTFGPSPSGSPLPDEEDADASWVDKLGTWKRRVL